MKKIFAYILFMIIGFVCFSSNVFATFTVELQTSSGKSATYKVKSSIKYSKDKVSVTPVSGIQSASITWNDDGLSGILKVTFSSADCTGDLTINYEASEGCEDAKPKNCDAILNDARSMIGKIPYEMGGKCASTSFEECKFNTIWTSKKDYPHIKNVNTLAPATDKYIKKNLERHGDGKGHSGLDCSGFVWWIYNRAGYSVTNGTGYTAAINAGVGNITSSSMVYSITKEQAQPCDLVSGSKPDSKETPHIGIVSKVAGGMMFIHENSKDDNVTENCYFDCEAPGNGKAVKYWRVKALWDGTTSSTNTCDGKENIHLDNSEKCTCDTCDEITINPEYIDGSSKYNNCCLDGDSYLKEYKISQLFCSTTNTKLDIQYYDDQCNNDAYNDDTFDSLLSGNEFCRVYCTEELGVETPKQIASASGKFFRLAEIEYDDLNGEHKTTRAPVIRGSKTCTIKSDYSKWRKYYVTNLKDEVDSFNDQQEALAYYEILRNPTVTTETISNTVSFNCVANNATEKKKTVGNNEQYLDSYGNTLLCTSSSCEVDAYVAYGSSYMDSSGNTTTCGSTVCREYEKKTSNPSTTCNNTYKLYTVNTSGKTGSISCSGGKCKTSYYQVKIDGTTDTDHGTSFNGLKVVSAGTKTAEYDEKTAWPETDNCTSALDTFKNSQSGYTCEQVGGAKTIPDGLKKERMDGTDDSKASEYKGIADNKTGILSGFTAKSKTLEKAMETCQNLFDKEGEGYAAEGTSAHDESKYYILNPTAKFKYMQVFLDGSNRKTDWQEINYSENDCQYTFKNTGVDDLDNKDIYYSNKFGTGEENMRDMKENDKRIINESELQAKLDTDDQGAKLTKKHRRDAQYNALCTWSGEDIPEKITLYPGPQVSSSYEDAGEKLISGHKFQYAVYLTTYKADYETYWELGNLGGSNRTIDKFIKYFNSDQAHTCASYVPERDCKDDEGHKDICAYSNGEPEDKIKPTEDTAKFTCVLQVKYGGMRIGNCEYGISGADDACDENQTKEVFEFKVVDPKEMFPGDWDGKAANWKKEDGSFGPTWDKIQNDTASDDKTYSPENLTYSYKLDPSAIKAIKSYNKDNSYTDYEYDKGNMKCVCPSDLYSSEDAIDKTDCGTIKKPASPECTTIINSKKKWKYTCRECQSQFLYDLSVNKKVGSTVLTDNVWNNTVSYNDVRSHNKNWA